MTQHLSSSTLPSKRLLLVADYGTNDLAFYEVVQKLQELAGDAKLEVDIVSANAFNVPETAVLVADGVTRGYDIVYHNTAPRLDGKPKDGNAGEGLGYIRVKNKDGKEVKVIGVASGNEEVGNTFSLVVRDFEAVTPLRDVKFAETGSQFRSRDAFPQEVVRVLSLPDEHNNHLRQPIKVDTLPADHEVKARAAVAGRLDVAEHQHYNRPGQSSKGYITVVGPASKAQTLLDQVKGVHPDAYVDFIPLKSSTPDRQQHEASFVAAQLGANAKASSTHRALYVVPTEEAAAQFAAKESLYHATLDSGAQVISPVISAFSFANLPFKQTGEGAIRSFTQLAFDGAVRTPDVNIAALQVPGWKERIPAADQNRIAYIDGYGNVKSSRLFEQYQKSADTVSVQIPGSDRQLNTGTTTQTSFDTKRGQTNLSRGSSGWGEQRFTEVWIRNGNAAEALGNPEPGQEISIKGFDKKQETPDAALAAITSLAKTAHTVLTRP